MNNDISFASKVEWDLSIAMAAAVGVGKAQVKVFSRYEIARDSIDLIVEHNGKFYRLPKFDGCTFTSGYVQAICDIVGEMLK